MDGANSSKEKKEVSKCEHSRQQAMAESKKSMCLSYSYGTAKIHCKCREERSRTNETQYCSNCGK